MKIKKLNGWGSNFAVKLQGKSSNAKALVLSDGATEVGIVAADLIGVTADIVARVREQVEKITAIPADHLLVCASHTHFGPVTRKYGRSPQPGLVDQPGPDPAYLDRLVDKMTGSVKTAHDNLSECQIGAGKGRAPELLFNRRTKRRDGSLVMTYVLPPEEKDLTFGPVDPEVGVFRVEDSEGSLIASLINFACHPVSGGGHGTGWESWFYYISADYPAYATQVPEMVEGGNCLFTLGTAGDLVPSRRGIKPRFEIGRSLGGEALRAMQFLPLSDKAVLKAVQRKISLPCKTGLPPDAINEIEPGEKTLQAEIQGIRAGDILFLGLPGEVLVELGLDIKNRAGVENLFLICLSNDSIGYICHAAAYAEGGYEPTRGSVLAEGAGEMLVEGALAVVRELKEGA